VPCHINEKEYIQKAIDSFGEFATKVILLGEAGNFNRIEHPNEWIAFIYSIEYIDETVRDSLETFLYTPLWDFYKLFKEDAEGRYWEAPRIFRAKIPIRREQIYPVDVEMWKGERILDGMIREQDV
jgi:hypothetical protein